VKPWNYHTARDIELPLRQRWASVYREPGFATRGMHTAVWHVLRAFLRFHEHLQIVGAEHLPARPPYVLVANHSSHLDALVLGSLLPERQLGDAFAVAAGDTFFADPVKSICSVLLLNALPFWRNRCVAQALGTLRQRLIDEEACLILFPEGTRTRDGSMSRFKSGIGVLAADADIPVLPCHISGAFEAWPPGRRFPRRGRIEVRIGPARRFSHCPNNRAGWRQIAGELEAAVRQLAGEPLHGGQEDGGSA
jgi:1-acyl-sn-glycerol-3-phosphate acyltransferase